MNEEIVSPTGKREEYKVLHVWPPQKCIHCDRLTVIVHIDPAFLPNFQPKCALHGLALCAYLDETIEEKEAALESVRRYVVWMHADTGRVVLAAPLEHSEEVPGYEGLLGYEEDEEDECDDIAWYTRYENPSGARIDSWVVWSNDSLHFFLYEVGTMVEQRQVEQVV